MDIDTNRPAKTYSSPIDPESDVAGAHILQLVGFRKRVVDVGAGPGAIAKLLVTLGECEVTAVEVDQECIKLLEGFCHKTIQADLNDRAWLESVDFDDADVIVIADVLEHLTNPWRILKNISDSMLIHTEIVISIPHVGHAGVIASLLQGDFRYSEWGILDKTHLRFFALKNVQQLLEFAGLKPVEVRLVRRDPNETEFSDNWATLSDAQRDVLRSEPNSLVYQFVVKAVRTNHPDYPNLTRLEDYVQPQPEHTRFIAFYLPQFHPIPENDEWWGKGFTEWTNVTKARPLFDGHYQPHLPSDLGFYDLRVPEIRREQIAYARAYGIDAFCFHYYWFGGRRILEKPVEAYFQDDQSDLPFCLCWANENWTRRWDASETEVLIGQEYSPDNDLEFIRSLFRFFRDPRYLRVGGRPVLIVYRPQQMPNPMETVQRWREACAAEGIGELHLVAALTHGNWAFEEWGFDAGVEFPPHSVRVKNYATELNSYLPFEGFAVQYRDVAESYLNHDYQDRLVYRTVFPSWDNTARLQGRAMIVLGSGPEQYERWINRATQLTVRERDPEHRLVFINAWNEWAEGCHLEPDRAHGVGFLEATLRAKTGRSKLIEPWGDIPPNSPTRVQRSTGIIRYIDQCLRNYPRAHHKAQVVWRDIRAIRSRLVWLFRSQ